MLSQVKQNRTLRSSTYVPDPNPQRWLITGASSGFGLELARAALARGDTVVGTLRQRAQADSFEQTRARPFACGVLDVTRADDIGPRCNWRCRKPAASTSW
jgi:NAD(P)-dependent dehydrogenase (short-subunit alcohol dehydrogenase family)